MLSKVQEKILISLIVLLPFSNFLIHGLDIWHAQGMFFQLAVLLLYFFKLYDKNKPLGALFLWSGILTCYYWTTVLIKYKEYAIGTFLPFFNLLCGIILFEFLIKTKREIYVKIVRYLCYGIFVILCYAVLQKLSLDQFFKSTNSFNNPNLKFPDEIVGTIGNQMHFSHYIAICLPLLFINKQYNAYLVLLAFAILSLTGSATGLAIAVLVTILYSFYFKIFSIREWVLLCIFAILFIIFKNVDYNLFSSSGRTEVWSKYLTIFQAKPITGYGLGLVNVLSKEPTLNFGNTIWRHLHCEYYQYLIELGIVGLGIIGWLIVDYYKKFHSLLKDNLSVSLMCVFTAFLLASIVGYPSHLWLTSSMAILSYSFMYRGDLK